MEERDTNKLVVTWENLLPRRFPKKPDNIAPNNGRKIIAISILTF